MNRRLKMSEITVIFNKEEAVEYFAYVLKSSITLSQYIDKKEYDSVAGELASIILSTTKMVTALATKDEVVDKLYSLGVLTSQGKVLLRILFAIANNTK
jgi:hypothetical protein